MIHFEWDESKAESNVRKHGISFDDAVEAFYDPEALLIQDRVVDGEVRWQLVGNMGGLFVVHVAHTSDAHGDDEFIRIISARRADRRELRLYGKDR